MHRCAQLKNKQLVLHLLWIQVSFKDCQLQPKKIKGSVFFPDRERKNKIIIIFKKKKKGGGETLYCIETFDSFSYDLGTLTGYQ